MPPASKRCNRPQASPHSPPWGYAEWPFRTCAAPWCAGLASRLATLPRCLHIIRADPLTRANHHAKRPRQVIRRGREGHEFVRTLPSYSGGETSHDCSGRRHRAARDPSPFRRRRIARAAVSSRHPSYFRIMPQRPSNSVVVGHARRRVVACSFVPFASATIVLKDRIYRIRRIELAAGGGHPAPRSAAATKPPGRAVPTAAQGSQDWKPTKTVYSCPITGRTGQQWLP
jgi:hypothetical protein